MSMAAYPDAWFIANQQFTNDDEITKLSGVARWVFPHRNEIKSRL